MYPCVEAKAFNLKSWSVNIRCNWSPLTFVDGTYLRKLRLNRTWCRLVDSQPWLAPREERQIRQCYWSEACQSTSYLFIRSCAVSRQWMLEMGGTERKIVGGEQVWAPFLTRCKQIMVLLKRKNKPLTVFCFYCPLVRQYFKNLQWPEQWQYWTREQTPQRRTVRALPF